jgi:hypothetical protein
MPVIELQMGVNPIAWRLAQARGGEEIIAAKLDPDPLRYVTWGSKSWASLALGGPQLSFTRRS